MKRESSSLLVSESNFLRPFYLCGGGRRTGLVAICILWLPQRQIPSVSVGAYWKFYLVSIDSLQFWGFVVLNTHSEDVYLLIRFTGVRTIDSGLISLVQIFNYRANLWCLQFPNIWTLQVASLSIPGCKWSRMAVLFRDIRRTFYTWQIKGWWIHASSCLILEGSLGKS